MKRISVMIMLVSAMFLGSVIVPSFVAAQAPAGEKAPKKAKKAKKAKAAK